MVGLLVIMPMLTDFNDSEAARVRAEASKIDAQRRYEHQQAVDFRHEIETVAVILASFSGGFTFKDAIIVAAVGGCALMGGVLFAMTRK